VGALQRIETELASDEERLNALSGRRDDLMQRRAQALADKQRCGERCVAACHAAFVCESDSFLLHCPEVKSVFVSFTLVRWYVREYVVHVNCLGFCNREVSLVLRDMPQSC
jgi:hypothetical protein